jgi:hypothetical protein
MGQGKRPQVWGVEYEEDMYRMFVFV